MFKRCEKTAEEKTYYLPVRIMDSTGVENPERLLTEKSKALSFRTDNCVRFFEKGSFILLDFGKEMCGGVRIITRDVHTTTRIRITFGESVSEAMSEIGYKNATNDHSPRDTEVSISALSDLEFGQTGFRFIRIELKENTKWDVLSIYGFCILPKIKNEINFKTNDELLNKIIETAVYTVKLCFQNGYIWDGIKRDRLVWCGDLHPEILTSLYAFGKTENIINSLNFLKDNTPEGEWINGFPSYSAWWIVCLCDYVRISGDEEYFNKSKGYALEILKRYNALIKENGKLKLPGYFLDWPTNDTEDAKLGTALLIRWAAQKYLKAENSSDAEEIIEKLAVYLGKATKYKQVKSFQVLCGKIGEDAKSFLENGGGQGMSTFMSYYILSACAKTGSKEALGMLKEYYGGMLSCGATSFWEDFDLEWVKKGGRIDEIPASYESDIHGDNGKFCYRGLRHSLCHGWSSGVLAFIVECILGLEVKNGFREVKIEPDLMGLNSIDAEIPTPYGYMSVTVKDEKIFVKAPDEITVTLG